MRGERDRNSLSLCALPSFPHFGILSGTWLLSHSVHPTPILNPYPRLIPSLWPESSFALESPIPFKKTSLLIVNSSLRIKHSYLLRACYAWSFTCRTHVLLKHHAALQSKEYSTLSVDETTRLAEVEHLTQTTNWKATEAGLSSSCLDHLAPKPKQLSTALRFGQWWVGPLPSTWKEWSSTQHRCLLAASASKQSSPDCLCLLFTANSLLMMSLRLCFILNISTFFSLLV